MVIEARFIKLRSDANIRWPTQFRSIQTGQICGHDMSERTKSAMRNYRLI